MKKITIYRVLTVALLPVAVLFILMAVFALLTALANPAMLLPVFMIGCVAIYIFATLRFLNDGILKGKICKASLKDWIKVNAIVTVIFGLLIVFQTAILASNPALMQQALNNSMQMQGNPQSVSTATLLKAMNVMMYVLLVIGIMLLVHTIMTFSFLKKYNHVFAPRS